MCRNYGETWGTPFLGAPLDPIRKLRQRAFGLLGQIGESRRIVHCQVGQNLAVEFYACLLYSDGQATIEKIALLYLKEGSTELPLPPIDESFRDRPAYREGSLTDSPDLSQYE